LEVARSGGGASPSRRCTIRFEPGEARVAHGITLFPSMAVGGREIRGKRWLEVLLEGRGGSQRCRWQGELVLAARGS